MTVLSDSSAAPAPPPSTLPADCDRAASTDTRARFAADEHGLATCSLSSMEAPSVSAMYALFATTTSSVLPLLI
uniref:Uncharacterized protein n=1 Tax=Arundo donax TaxID=35708 RepID=A0A0A8XY20_ARUDO